MASDPLVLRGLPRCVCGAGQRNWVRVHTNSMGEHLECRACQRELWPIGVAQTHTGQEGSYVYPLPEHTSLADLERRPSPEALYEPLPMPD